jgi:hypothetical protein
MRLRGLGVMAWMVLGLLTTAQEKPAPEPQSQPPAEGTGTGGAGAPALPPAAGAPSPLSVPEPSPSSEETEQGASMPGLGADPGTSPSRYPQGSGPGEAPAPPSQGESTLEGVLVGLEGRQLRVQVDSGALVSVQATASTVIDGQAPRSAEHLERLLERKREEGGRVHIVFKVEDPSNVAVSID